MADKVEENKERVTVSRKTVITGESEETSFGNVDEIKIPGIFSKLLKMNSPEIVFIIFGCLGALVAGSVEPLFAIALSDFISTFSRHPLGLVSILANLFIIMNYQCICKFKHQNLYSINKMGSE